MNHDERAERDGLWTLLGRARSPEVSADFARRTALAVREGHAADRSEELADAGGRRMLTFPMLLRRAAVSTAAAAAACVALLLMWQQLDGPETGDPGHLAGGPERVEAVEASMGVPLDMEPWEWEMAELDWIDQVVAANDPSALSDAALAYLLY